MIQLEEREDTESRNEYSDDESEMREGENPDVESEAKEAENQDGTSVNDGNTGNWDGTDGMNDGNTDNESKDISARDSRYPSRQRKPPDRFTIQH